MLDWSHRTDDLTTGAKTFERTVSQADLAQLARSLGVAECQSCAARYTLRPRGHGAFVLTGSASAAVTQECVVTLVAVQATVRVDLEVAFSANPSPPQPAIGDEDITVSSLPEVEPIEGSVLDVGRVIFDALAAEIDPYPKATDAAFTWADETVASGATHPFAALAALKPKA